MAFLRELRVYTVRLLIIVLFLLLPACNAIETGVDVSDAYSKVNRSKIDIAVEEVEKHTALDGEWPPLGEDQIIIRAGIFQSWLHERVYYFTVSQNGLLEASLGRANTDFPPTNLMPGEAHLWDEVLDDLREGRRTERDMLNFNEDLIDMLGTVEDIATRQLTRAEFEHLLEMAEEIERINPEQQLYFSRSYGFGLYTLYLNFNDTFYLLRHASWQEEVISSFIDKLFAMSPIQMPSELWSWRREMVERGEIQLDRWKRVRFPERPHDGFDGFWWADQIFRLERGFIPLDRWKPNRAND